MIVIPEDRSLVNDESVTGLVESIPLVMSEQEECSRAVFHDSNTASF